MSKVNEARLEKVELMLRFGLPLHLIAETVQCSITTVERDKARLGPVPTFISGDKSDHRKAITQKFAEMYRIRGLLTGAQKSLYNACWKYLELDEVKHFAEGIRSMCRELARPRVAPGQEPYLKLLEAIFGGSYNFMPDLLNDYLAEVARGMEPVEDIKAHLTTQGARSEWLIAPVWPEGYRKEVDKVFTDVLSATLQEMELDVIRYRFGLENRRAHTLTETGVILGDTPEHIRYIETKALRKLRHPNRNQRLRGLLRTDELVPKVLRDATTPPDDVDPVNSEGKTSRNEAGSFDPKKAVQNFLQDMRRLQEKFVAETQKWVDPTKT